MGYNIAKIRIASFEPYGLNKYRNFMAAPECECGCGGKGKLIVQERDELFGFMSDVLFEHDCEQSAIFAHAQDDNMYAAVKHWSDDEDDYEVSILSCADNMEFFAELDGEFRFCCYGLIIEDADGEWQIVED